VVQGHRGARATVTRAFQTELNDAVDDVDQFDISAVGLERGPDLIDRFFNFGA
jgi:hypothetical protein